MRRRSTFAAVAGLLLAAPLAAQHREPLRDTIPEVTITGHSSGGTAIRVVPVAFYQPVTGVGIGVAALRIRRSPFAETRPDDQTLVMSATTRQQYRFFIQGDFWTRRNRFTVSPEFELTLQSLPFFGIGPDAPEAALERYRARTLRANVFALVQLGGGYYVGSAVGFRSNLVTSTAPGGAVGSGVLTGSRMSTVTTLDLLAIRDTRDNVFSARRGTFLSVRAGGAPSALSTTRGYVRLTVDGRFYMPVRDRSTVAMQFVADMTDGDVPFDLLPQFTTDGSGRAYESGRFRDRVLMMTQLEWRQTLSRRFGVAVFGQLAKVGPSLGRLAPFENLHPSGGVSIRYALVPRERAYARLDFGIGRGSTAFFVGFAEAF